MKKSQASFITYLDQIKKHIKKAETQPNPAFGLYLADARTPAFRLEGLARLYAGLQDKKYFSKLNKQIKQLEDGLGAIDHYTALEKEFSPSIKVPVAVKSYFVEKIEGTTDALNIVLRKEKWLNGDRIKTIKQKLKQVEWMSAKKETKAITTFFKNETAKITQFISECKFTDMENDVHELRRKLRWLSIYAMALQGKVQLAENKNVETHLKKYLTPQVINSPFNKIEASPKLQHIMLDKNHFLALSWLIAELGKIKDDGLRIMALSEAYMHTESVTEKTAAKKAQAALGTRYPTTAELLKKAATISRNFIKEENLTKLVL